MSDTNAATDAAAKAAVLTEALPYIRRFAGKVVVVKYGGNALADPDTADTFAGDIVMMRSVGLCPVVVHGGGPQIGELLRRLGLESTFVDGLRVTDAATLDVARMVLVGKVNRELVSAINVHAPVAVGLSGEDAGLLSATPRDPDLGFVGDVSSVNTGIVDRLLAEDLVPVVATIGTDAAGQAYNINADSVAASLAVALGAHKLVYLTDIEGLRRDVTDAASLISRIGVTDLAAMVADGTVGSGMIPKVRGCIDAIAGGVGHAHVLDGRLPHALLLEFFTREGIGTMVVPDEEV